MNVKKIKQLNAAVMTLHDLKKTAPLMYKAHFEFVIYYLLKTMLNEVEK